jgi:hypothetical protein
MQWLIPWPLLDVRPFFKNSSWSGGEDVKVCGARVSAAPAPIDGTSTGLIDGLYCKWLCKVDSLRLEDSLI